MIKKYKNYLLGLIGILLIFTIYIGVKYLMRPKYEDFPEVVLKEITDNKAFAIMVPNKSGDGYVAYSGNTWPSEEYEFKEAKCVDNNGSLIENVVTFVNGKATLKTNQTVYCTLYFDIKPPLNLRTLCENYNNMQICMEQEKNNIGEVETLSSNMQGEMYRYQGLDKQYENDNNINPEKLPVVKNNFICFGTTDNKECVSEGGSDKYMYRIIGVTPDGQIELIKKEFLNSNGTVLKTQWNNKGKLSFPYDGTEECDDDKCDWPNTTLFKNLNGIGENNIFINSEEYDYLNNKNGETKWYKLIADHNWTYGDFTTGVNPEEYYDIETGVAPIYRCAMNINEKEVRESNLCEATFWKILQNQKIGLRYYYDANYSLPVSGQINNEYIIYSWLNYEYNQSNKTVNHNCEWTIARGGISSYRTNSNLIEVYYTSFCNAFGRELSGAFYSSEKNPVRPVFYLDSSIKIKSGDGTESNPFILLN